MGGGEAGRRGGDHWRIQGGNPAMPPKAKEGDHHVFPPPGGVSVKGV